MPGVVGYARVSTEEQAKINQSLPVQKRRIGLYCEQSGIPLLKVFEGSESARTAEREGLQRALEFCRENRKKVSHFVVCDLSRLARNNQDQAQIILELKILGITFVSIDEPLTDDSALGLFIRNVYGSVNQLFSDQLSERTKYRMQAAVKAGRFPFPAPLGYVNRDKRLYLDSERAPLIREAFELVASGRYATTDAVLKVVSALGLTTKKGKPVTKQTFARMLQNPIYCGWVVSGELKARGDHEAIIPEELFNQVQKQLNTKGTSHKKLNEDFPLRGVIRCATCGKLLTAGWSKGRNKHYAHYWCWTPKCRKVNISGEALEKQFVSLLSRIEPTAELISELPTRIAEQWKERKEFIDNSSKPLNRRLADQKALNHKAILAKLSEEITADDFDSFKVANAEAVASIEAEIKALDSERETMTSMLEQAAVQAVDLVGAWEKGDVKSEAGIAKSFFPDGLVFSHKRGFFEPANTVINEMLIRFLIDFRNNGAPNGI